MSPSTPVCSPEASVMVSTPKPLLVQTANSSSLWFHLKSIPLLITQNQHVYTGVTKQPQKNSFSFYPRLFSRLLLCLGFYKQLLGYIFSSSLPPIWRVVIGCIMQYRQHIPHPIPFLLKSCPVPHTNFGLFNFILCSLVSHLSKGSERENQK